MSFWEKFWLVFILFNLLLIAILWLYPRVKYNWLDKISDSLILSLPFQGFPSLLGEIVNLRISQVLVSIGLVMVLLLYLKKDENLLSQKVNSFFLWASAFFLVSVPGWFYIINFNRFLQFLVGTLLVFGATFIISHFGQNIWRKVRLLMITMIITSLVGLYQLITDMLNLTEISLLKEGYTKAVFGISRIHSFLPEPLYLAGALFFPIFLASLYWLTNQNLFTLEKLIKSPKLLWITQPRIINLGLLILFGLVFLLTYSKSAFLAISINLALLVFLSIKKYQQWALFKIVSVGITMAAITIFMASLISPTLSAAITEIKNNFIQSLTGESTSAIERNTFIEAATNILPEFAATGIGLGQFGPRVAFVLRHFYNSDQLIVNNIYLEVWLENGFLAFCLFIGLWLWVLMKNWRHLIYTPNWTEPLIVLRLALVLTLQSYLIQWFFFSPLYIMPIFILLGLLLALDRQEQVQAPHNQNF